MSDWNHMLDLTALRRCRAWVEIDLSALSHNVWTFKRLLAPGVDLLAVVKADAYGHGAVMVARTALAAGANWLGVATVPEGVELRQAGITSPIMVMGAVNDPAEMGAIAVHQLQPTITNPQQAQTLSATLQQLRGLPQGSALPVHIKLDTGMSRLGMPWQQAVAFVDTVSQLQSLRIASVYSHLATADEPDPATMWQQHQRFEQALAALDTASLLPPVQHLANTAATLIDTKLHYHRVRVGLGLYGLSPAPHLQHYADLRTVLQVKARITHVKDLETGAGVSYGHRFVAPHPMKIAVVGIGYADGVPRLLSNHLDILIAGQRVRQLGAITMDQLMIDITQVPTAQVGDTVTLLGHSQGQTITADDWANTIGTISWEILSGFKHRLPRLIVDGGRTPTAPPMVHGASQSTGQLTGQPSGTPLPLSQN